MAYDDINEKISNTAKKKARSYTKKKLRRANRLTGFICLLALVGGFFAGAYAYEYLCSGDCFVLQGQKEYAVALNSAEFIYNDDGAKVVEFGRDISDSVVTETNMTDLGGGKYTVDTTVSARYYIKYTVDSPKYGKVARIRTFVVGGEE